MQEFIYFFAVLRRRWLRSVVLGVAASIVMGLAACSTPERKLDGVGVDGDTAAATGPRWHYLRFHWSPPSDGPVPTHLDLAIAAEVVGPLLETHGADLRLWRFHRRWPADDVGHLFSWIVYAPPDTVIRLADLVRAHPLTQRLADEERLERFNVDELSGPKGAAIGATSDPDWSAEVREAWPEYIQGASRLWLGLVRSAALDVPGDIDPRYRAVEARVERLWYEQADHAMLHHLNALFGYRPLRVRGQGVMSF